MKKIKAFITTMVLGGVVVVLPVTILIVVFKWVYDMVIKIIDKPMRYMVKNDDIYEPIAAAMVLLVIAAICFVIGFLVRTRLGIAVYHWIERSLLVRAPGYSLVKEIVIQFLGQKKSPFSSVALVQLYGNETLASAFVTDTHEDGRYTVFVPTGPNPTSGNIFHLEGKYVHHVNVPVEQMMRSIISCGAGSKMLLSALNQVRASTPDSD